MGRTLPNLRSQHERGWSVGRCKAIVSAPASGLAEPSRGRLPRDTGEREKLMAGTTGIVTPRRI